MHDQSGQVGEWVSKSEVKKPDTAQTVITGQTGAKLKPQDHTFVNIWVNH